MSLDTTPGGAAADSYATLAEYQARAAAMGWTLSGADATDEANLRRAAVALDATFRFIGFRTEKDGSRSWPRVVPSDYLVDGWSVPSSTIPQAIKDAQMEMAHLIQTGADPLATQEGAIKRERVDVIEVEYTGGKGRPRYDAVERLLAGYLATSPGQTQVVRG